MKKTDIQRLIDRYLDDITTPHEEKLLARALLDKDIPQEWKIVRMMLGELTMGEAEYDAEMEARNHPKHSPLKKLIPWTSAAACIALVLGFMFMHFNRSKEEHIIKEKNIAHKIPNAASEIKKEIAAPVAVVVKKKARPQALPAPHVVADTLVTADEPAADEPATMCPMVTAKDKEQEFYQQLSAEVKQQLEALELEYEMQCLNEEYEKSKAKHIEL